MKNQNSANGKSPTTIRNTTKIKVTNTRITPCKNYNLHTETFDECGQIFGIIGRLEVTSAYTIDKFLIGAPSFAAWICDDLGIVPEPIESYDAVCRIGFSLTSNLWNAWNGEQLYGFGIGKFFRYNYYLCEDTVDAKQTCKFEEQIVVFDNTKKQLAQSLDEAKQMAIDFALND